MYDGFVTADLRKEENTYKAMEHIGAMYSATANALLAEQGGTPGEWEFPLYHKRILCEVIMKYQDDLKRITLEPNVFKQAGYLTFWIRKLKPFRHYPLFGNTLTNEYLGLHFGLSILVTSDHSKRIEKLVGTERLWDELLYDLRYRPVSGHELSKQFEMLVM
jgi:hypothetical protein